MLEVRVSISRPVTENFSAIDDRLIKRLEMLGFQHDGSGAGLGQRDLEFAATDRATALAESDPLWDIIRSELAALARCEVTDVEIVLFNASAAVTTLNPVRSHLDRVAIDEQNIVRVDGNVFGRIWRQERDWFLHVDAEQAGYSLNVTVHEEAVNEARRLVAQALANGAARRAGKVEA